MSWGAQPKPTQEQLSPAQALADWERKKEALAKAKDEESEARKLAMKLNAPDAKEGVNNIPLKNGYVLKATRKVSRKFAVPAGFGKIGDREPTIVDAVDQMIDEFRRHSNEGAFIADRFVKWSADMSDKEYKNLPKELKAIADKYIVSDDAMPSLEIKAPKE